MDPNTRRPVGYDPFYGTGSFVKEMWQKHRQHADRIGEETLRRGK